MTTMTAVDQPLSEELKSSTAQAHDQAEHSTFMQELIDGHRHSHAFASLQEQAWFFYSALEAAASQLQEDPRAARIIDPALHRADRLASDLTTLYGSDSWRETAKPTPATAEYVARLEQIGKDKDAARFIAHHYVRYLGDLSGGQVIARMMTRYYGVEKEALSFYDFSNLSAKPKPYKDAYRATLDDLDLTDQERKALLEEASDAFTFNMRVFSSLD